MWDSLNGWNLFVLWYRIVQVQVWRRGSERERAISFPPCTPRLRKCLSSSRGRRTVKLLNVVILQSRGEFGKAGIRGIKRLSAPSSIFNLLSYILHRPYAWQSADGFRSSYPTHRYNTPCIRDLNPKERGSTRGATWIPKRKLFPHHIVLLPPRQPFQDFRLDMEWVAMFLFLLKWHGCIWTVMSRHKEQCLRV